MDSKFIGMAFAARLALLCAFACATISAGPAPHAPAALLARMRAADGGLFRAHISSTSMHAVDGEPAALQTDVQDLRYLQSQCTGSVCLGTYFDGERLFSVNINGTALPYSRSAEAHVRALRILAMEAFLDPQFEGNVYDAGAAIFDGRPVRAIYVTDPIALPMKIFVDPQTGLITGARTISGGETYALRDYRRVGPFELPFQVLLNGAPLETYITRRVVYAPLRAPQGLSFEHVAGAADVMPLDPGSVSPLGTCTLGGVDVTCLIDSGNSAMAMSVELSEQLGLHPVGMLRVAGLGRYATEVVRAGPLRMGGVQFGDANYIVLSDIHSYGYDLVVGADVLAALPVTIDSKIHELVFGESAEPADTALPLTFENLVPVVDVQLDNVDAALAVDTGDQSTINLGYDFYEQHPGLFQATKTRPVSGVGGRSEELIGQIGRVTIGGVTADDQQIGTTRVLRGTADGHLGAGFLANYRIQLDYAHSLMRLGRP